VRFELPLPPTTNSLFATDFKTKRRFISKEYAAWKRAAGALLREQYARYDSPEVLKPVHLRIQLNVNHQSDIANREKAITDLLVHTLDMPDDRYIDRLVIERDREIEAAVVTIGEAVEDREVYGAFTSAADLSTESASLASQKPGGHN
jgi:Holliday junction resolvase RusA-like endonuclease